MIVKIDTEAKTISLADADNTEKLHAEVTGSMNPALVDEVIADNAAGRLVGPNAYLSVAKLREWAAGNTSDGWDTRFQAMLNKAGEQGWMNDDRTYVMAHLVEA